VPHPRPTPRPEPRWFEDEATAPVAREGRTYGEGNFLL
jgi:hypothetical protein